MAQPTFTRKQLRRGIAIALAMPFFRRFSAQEGTIDSGSTTTNIIDAMLNQPQGYWNGHWFYGLLAGDLSIIRAFNVATHGFQLENPMASTPTAGDKYEIHTIWNAVDIHNAINQAIKDGARAFPETVNDMTMIFCEDKMSYSLSGLAKKPFIINKIYAEKPTSVVRGMVGSANASSLTISEAASNLAGVNSNYLVSIYAGTGANQNVPVVSVVGQQVNVSSWPGGTPDNTSKYAIYNPNIERFDLTPLDIFYTSEDEYPTTLRFRSRLPFYYGMRMRIEYLYANTEMSADTDTTVIPDEYIKMKACSLLHAQKLNDTKADRDLHYAEYQRWDKMATDYLNQNMVRMPGVTIAQSSSPSYMDTEDPLGWWTNN